MQSNKFIIITTAILILSLMSAGCTDSTTPKAEIPATNTEPVSEPVTVSNPETPVEVETPVSEPIVEQTPEPVETTPWYVDKYGFEDAEVGTHSTLFGEDITCVKNYVIGGGSYSMYDMETSNHILDHQEFDPSNLNLPLDLGPDQYKELTAQYGSLKSATMETIDDNRDGTMDRVAVKYEGTDGTWTEEFNYFKAANLKSYIQAHMDPTIYPELIITHLLHYKIKSPSADHIIF